MVQVEGPADPHHIPGYTGFLPGGQHQMAKTYGQASAATLAERQANDDPLKWRKFVSYAEFTPAHTPVEGHHIPGYSGHVPGLYAENLYAKTYGKTTLQAVSGNFPKGCEQVADEQYKTTNQLHHGDSIPHPGRPTDIMPGGASWTGSSPYNQIEGGYDLEPVNPWPPSVVQIAGGKEPPQTSIILKNFPPTCETKEPALRITGKGDPHDPSTPGKKTISVTGGNFQIPGYSGFVPGIQAENLFSGTYAKISSRADEIRDRKKPDSETFLKVEHINADGVLPLKPDAPRRLRTAEMPTTATDGPSEHAKHLPGYTGFVPGVQAENIYGKTYGHASHIAISGKHARYQWSEQAPEDRFQSSSRQELLDFGHPAKIEDGHVTYAHETTNPANANYRTKKGRSTHEFEYHIPGYAGFIPDVKSKSMVGKTHYAATKEALERFHERLTRYDEQKPKSAPAGPLTPAGAVGMLQFKPNGFLYQKRMQGEWNNGMLGARNYSAVRLAEGNHWKGNLYQTTSKELHRGHSSSDVPHCFSKGPAPTFENMDHALKHKSVYLGFYAL